MSLPICEAQDMASPNLSLIHFLLFFTSHVQELNRKQVAYI